ncbi:hypothetical protein K461DRAFT_278658 [Myriangium duriaei CBS 260.36]|uniref:Uncharacterized protein n=1 Tax=Myriangium duriaei CBS 260.36 TaxID=1168546 RepID=A0A9P4MM62_9PEZI|nr:hypothetical protein K461DRAFT_278658 [Myriangium duriaei CBS 260.36]
MVVAVCFNVCSLPPIGSGKLRCGLARLFGGGRSRDQCSTLDCTPRGKLNAPISTLLACALEIGQHTRSPESRVSRSGIELNIEGSWLQIRPPHARHRSPQSPIAALPRPH